MINSPFYFTPNTVTAPGTVVLTNVFGNITTDAIVGDGASALQVIAASIGPTVCPSCTDLVILTPTKLSPTQVSFNVTQNPNPADPTGVQRVAEGLRLGQPLTLQLIVRAKSMFAQPLDVWLDPNMC